MNVRMMQTSDYMCHNRWCRIINNVWAVFYCVCVVFSC